MSASGSSDPRLLLPEWLRDGDMPVAAQPAPDAVPAAPIEDASHVVELEPVEIKTMPVAPAPATPFSDRLSLDTRLDPGQLVSVADLPGWLGGLERVSPSVATRPFSSELAGTSTVAPPIDEPEPYLGVDAPADRAIEVEVSGLMLVAGAVGLLILVLAALKLYLS